MVVVIVILIILKLVANCETFANILVPHFEKKKKNIIPTLAFLNVTYLRLSTAVIAGEYSCKVRWPYDRYYQPEIITTLPSLQDIYLKRCRSRAAKIIKDSNHPGNHLFRLLPSGKRFRSLMAKTERLRRSFFPQAIRLLNTNSVP